MEEVAEGHAREVFAGFEHAEAVAAERVSCGGATDLGGNPVRDDEGLGMCEYAGLRQQTPMSPRLETARSITSML